MTEKRAETATPHLPPRHSRSASRATRVRRVRSCRYAEEVSDLRMQLAQVGLASGGGGGGDAQAAADARQVEI
jgi:hypothetical protein